MQIRMGKSGNSQTQIVKDKMNLLMDIGERDKKKIFDKIVDETGIPRPTVRRIAGDLKREIKRKIKILTDPETLKRIQKKSENPYRFIPESIRVIWEGKTKSDFLKISCSICKIPLAYSLDWYDGKIICGDCKEKFPERSRLKKRHGK